MKRLTLHLLSLLFFTSIVTIGSSVPASATTAGFDAGRIIDDSIFTNKSSMTAQDIQNFLNSKVPTCDTNHAAGPNAQGATPPWTCLKNYYENVSTGANNLSGAAIPSGGISAAQIIWNYADQFNINPQVLIVTLQKENGIITDTWPYPWQYRTAMGFACPDTAACDPNYYGFAKQVYQAARHFRNFYDENPDWTVPYKVGTRYVQYNPSSSCGGTNVNIATHGTAALYSYTPYQPNAASLAAGYGSADPNDPTSKCSSYGNRNFYNYFTDWFGSTLVYAYQFVSATNPPAVMQPGQSATVRVVLKNTGGKIWWDETNAVSNPDPTGGGSPTPMRLYTTQPTDHANPFGGGGGWVGQTRMTMLSGKAGPGDPSIFEFSYKAPMSPGTYTEHFAPTIENVVKLADVGMAFTVTVPKVYSYQFVSATNPTSTMLPGQSATATVVLKNTGNVAWGNESNSPSTPMRLFTTQANDHKNPFGGGSGWIGQNRMSMQESTVAPGQSGTFSFNFTAPSTPGQYREHFAPTIENVIKMTDTGMEFDVSVPQPYAYKFVSAINPPSTMSKGQTVTTTVVLQNLGGVTWGNESSTPSTPFRLFTTQPQDHINPFGGGIGWVGKIRMTMQNASAAYSENATFSFDYTAPQTPGKYCDGFAPTIENIIKLTDIGMQFCVTVQ